MATIEEARRVAAIIRDAGGRVVGRTRLQKMAFILEASGLGSGFPFIYKHFGPYSEELSSASRTGAILGLLSETEAPASWGGTFSTFEVNVPPDPSTPESRRRIARETVTADAVELELAATALYLSQLGTSNVWTETARRKPEKSANGRLDRARALYGRIQEIQTPIPLPQLA
jgi:uncharacterized protein YwgA